MTTNAPQTIYLNDYQEPYFKIHSTALEFELFEDSTLVTATLEISRIGSHQQGLALHGKELELLSVAVNGTSVDEQAYQLTDQLLELPVVDDHFHLTTVCRIKPQENTSLEGLYRSRRMYCTQCEAEGFRKITYYLDRPDVLSVFTCKITASKSLFPILLANGNCIDSGDLNDGRHWKLWHDPFPKPSYLFALVAGDLSCVEDSFVTMSGRRVRIQVFVEQKDIDKCSHAVASLKNAMAWDEQVYGREYDLDVFMIVAVDDFNMGAMENKGLNIFNTSCVLASSQTTTDAGFLQVEGVVAHEYFHNWSGNRVTCRDWFQLSLKEGFTVFRDAEFSADMGSRTVKRVADVQLLRNMQFAEDAGPMAHPVRPASFIEISNFYTLTVYEKGAEVVRMIRTLIGDELFRRGSDLYFTRHDGQAVTVDDFVAAMAEVSGRDFSQFMHWYNQAGTPVVEVQSHYDAVAQTLTLSLAQSCPTTPEASTTDKKPFLIPITMGLLGREGPIPAKLSGADTLSGQNQITLELVQPKQEFIFEDVAERPTISLLRGFSAPIKLVWDREIQDLRRTITLDPDGFARWDAIQTLAIQAIGGVHFPINHALHALLESVKILLQDADLDPAMVALMLELPSETYLTELQADMDIDGVIYARQTVSEILAESLKNELFDVYQHCRLALEGKSQDVSAPAMALRSLKNTVLGYLMLVDNDSFQSVCVKQYENGENMTDVMAGLKNLVHCPFHAMAETKLHVLDRFYRRWQGESLVMNQWFAVQASDPSPGALGRVEALLAHQSYDAKNPNKIRSLIGVFARQNLRHFHAANGGGYRFLANQILGLDAQNPQIAARLVSPLSKWRRLDELRGKLMREQLLRIRDSENLSKDVYEMVNKSLAG